MAFDTLQGLLRRNSTAQGEQGARVSARLVEVSRMAADDTFDEFKTSIQGLIESEAEERLAEYGPNTVVREVKHGFFYELFTRLANPLNILLIVLTAVSVATQPVRARRARSRSCSTARLSAAASGTTRLPASVARVGRLPFLPSTSPCRLCLQRTRRPLGRCR